LRVLIVNLQSVNHNNATGITLRSIFSRFRKEDIYEVYMQPCLRASDAISLQSERLQAGVCLPRKAANRLIGKASVSNTKAAVILTEERSFLRALRRRLIMLLDFEPVILMPGLMRKINLFRPDCIYTLGNAIDVMKLVVKLSVMLKIPVIPHFMDNWQTSHRYGKSRYPYHRKITQKWLKKLYSRSNCALVISERMASEYTERWKVPHYALMNSVNTKSYHCPRTASKKMSVLVYAGGLHLNRYKSLLQIGKAIDDYNQTHQCSLVLRVYTDDKSTTAYQEILSECSCVEFRSYVPHELIMEVYRSADILVHIETFDEGYRDFIRYSLSTKISEYLSVGRPIFLYAPDNIFISEYLKMNKAAVTVSSEVELPTALRRLLIPANAETVSRNAYELAKRNHDTEHLNSLLRRVFYPECENGNEEEAW